MEKREAIEDITWECFNSGVQEMQSQEEIARYAMAMVTYSVALLRGVSGIEFANILLLSAINEERPVFIRPIERK
jgi:hypothetical protein